MFKPKDLPVEKIIYLYTVEHLPSTEIAKQLGITFPTVLNRLRNNNISIRPKHGNPYNKTRIQLSELPPIIKEPKTENQIITGNVTCPSCGTLRKLTLNRHRIKDIIKVAGRCRECAMKARAIQLNIKSIKYLYEVKCQTAKDIAKKYNVSPHVIIRILRCNDLRVRPKNEGRKLKFQKAIKRLYGFR